MARALQPVMAALMACLFAMRTLALVQDSRSQVTKLPFVTTIGDYEIRVTSEKGLLVEHKKLHKQFGTTGFPFLHVRHARIILSVYT